MSQAKAVNQQVVGVGVAVAALVAAVVGPMSATHPLRSGVSPDIALTGLVDEAAGAASIDLGGAFDLDGLLQAEVGAGEDLFNGVIGIPANLISDVVGGVEGAINDAIALNLGDAFSSLTGIPAAIAGTLIGVAGLPLELYNMALVLPGEYLFNFGGDASGTAATDPAASAAAAGLDASSLVDFGDSGGPHLLDFSGLLGAELAGLAEMFSPLAIFGSTAEAMAMPFLGAIADAVQLNFEGVFTDLIQGFEGEAGLLFNTLEPMGAAALTMALDPAYYLFDFNPAELFAL